MENVNTKSRMQKHNTKNVRGKMWKLANSDGRTYKQVVKLEPEEQIEVPINENIEKRLQNAFVCYLREGLTIRRVVEDIGEKRWNELTMSCFDSHACIIRKVRKDDNVPIHNEKVEVFKSYFKEVIPWNTKIEQVVIRRFEIVGIPLHLWNELTINKIGSCIGEVVEIHDLRYSFDLVEYTINALCLVTLCNQA